MATSRHPAARGMSPLQRSAFSIAIGLAFASGSALAQTEEKKPAKDGAVELGTVKVEAESVPYKADTVSSPKFTQALVDTPQTIVVIKKELMADQGATNLTEALRATTGITLQMGENGNTTSGDAVFMRGTDAQNSIFLDNVRDLGAASRDTFNIEQVEVAKGPAGADNGRGSASGYINLASKVPTIGNAYNGTLSYGTNERRRVTADLNQAIGDHTAVRMNLVDQAGGVAGRDVVERKTLGVAPSIGLGLGTDTRFYLYSQHIRQDNIPDGGLPAFGVKNYEYSAAQLAFFPDGNLPEPADSSNFYGLNSDFDKIKADMVTARFEHDLAQGITIRNLSRYGKNEQKRVLTGAGNPAISSGSPAALLPADQWTVSRSRQYNFRTNEVLTNQTNVTAEFDTGIIKHSVSSGAEVIYESLRTPAYTTNAATANNPNTQPSANYYNPDPSQAAALYGRTGAYTDAGTLTTALYAFDTIKFGERWLVNGGLRWERYDTDYLSVAALPTPNPDAAVQGAATSVNGADNLLSWKTGVVFKPVSNGSVYLAYANQLQPPGSDLSLTPPNAADGTPNANVNSPNLDPRRSINIELGTKWDLLEGKLAATAALFQTTIKNDQATTDSTGPAPVVVQFGEREVKGIELGLNGLITQAWTISAGVTYQDTTVKEGSVNNTVPFDPNNPSSGSAQNGAAINFSPKWNAALWSTYELPFKLKAGGGLRYVDTSVRGLPNAATGVTGTGLFSIPSYTVFDGFLSYPVTNKIGVQLNVYNLTDKFYTSSVNNGGSRYTLGTPRSFWLTLNARF